MKLNSVSTGFRKVTVGFLFVIAIISLNVVVSYMILRQSNSTISRMTEVLNPYMEKMEEFNLLVTESKMFSTNWVYLQNSTDDKKNLLALHETQYPSLKKTLNEYLELLNKKADKDSMEAVFGKFEDLLQIEKKIMAELVTFEDYENPKKKFIAEDLVESEVLPRTDDVMHSLKSTIRRNREEAVQVRNELIASFNKLLVISLSVSIGLFLLIILAAMFITSAIRKPVQRMREIVMQLGKGELPEHQIPVTRDVIGEMAESVNRLSESFTKTSIFASQIGKGNLSVGYERLGEKDMLGNALIQMRDSLKVYSENLEEKVRERTQEVIEKNQKLELAYREIRDSIHYAKRIQEAILPANQVIHKTFEDAFIFYRPKDIVCGDFYWFAQKGDEVVMAAIDCTGHGVPGALMTVIGNSILHQIVNFSGITDPAKILNQLDRKLLETLRHSGGAITNDGMDVSVCRYRISKQELTFAGAKRPLYLFKGGELIEIKGNKFPIGSFQYDSEKLFTEHRLNVKNGDSIYMFSDGYQDQFGGHDGKKFMVGRFRDMLVEIQSMPMKEQHRYVEKKMSSWQGKMEQTDDVLLMGIRF
ncbi:MAG TPA: SpoIIE family protein phosphatase [Bacteroidia bacterium]|nr:SpoIIE family protein phosphatase [Bacteroidia bacterium]